MAGGASAFELAFKADVCESAVRPPTFFSRARGHRRSRPDRNADRRFQDRDDCLDGPRFRPAAGQVAWGPAVVLIKALDGVGVGLACIRAGIDKTPDARARCRC